MIKAIILLFDLLAIFLYGIFFPGPVTISQTAPSSADRNNSILVQVTINKGDLNGAGKFTEQLPAGFNAVAIDDEGAQTSFDSNTVAFTWGSLPSDGVLNISFRVDITSSAAVQNYSLTGKFYYTSNNQNSEADAVPSNINITDGQAAQSSGLPSGVLQNNIIPQGNSSPSNSMSQNNIPVQSSSSPQVTNVNTSPGKVFVVRQFTSATITPNTGTKVIFTIHKDGITGFAKIEDSIPPGFTASQGDLDGASFTFIDNRAKFVWDNLPSDSVFTVSYLISANSNVPGTHVVVGNFSYIDNTNNPSSISIGSSVFNSSILPGYDIAAERSKNTPPPPPPPAPSPAANIASTQTANISSSGNTAPNSTPPATVPSENTTASQTANSSPSANTTPNSTPPATVPSENTTASQNTNITPASNSNTIVSDVNNQPAEAANTNVASSSQPEANPAPTPEAASDITYRVQIMALRNPVPASYFQSRKRVKEHVNTEVEGGLTKYTIGNYTDYKSVKDEKDDLKNRGFEGAFVVCYKAGVRITLQEALNITHQQ